MAKRPDAIEYSEWADIRSDEYEDWTDFRSEFYEKWTDMRSDIYDFCSDARTKLWKDDVDKAKKEAEDFRKDILDMQ